MQDNGDDIHEPYEPSEGSQDEMADRHNPMLSLPEYDLSNDVPTNAGYHSDEFQYPGLLRYTGETEAKDESDVLPSSPANNMIEEEVTYPSLSQIALPTTPALTIEEEFTKYSTQDSDRAAYGKAIDYDTRKREQIAMLVYNARQEDDNGDWKTGISEWLKAIGMNEELVWGTLKDKPAEEDLRAWKKRMGQRNAGETLGEERGHIPHDGIVGEEDSGADSHQVPEHTGQGPTPVLPSSSSTQQNLNNVSKTLPVIITQDGSSRQPAACRVSTIDNATKRKRTGHEKDIEDSQEVPESGLDNEEGSVPSPPSRKRKYRREAEKKMERPEITEFPPEDQWKPDDELIVIAATKDPIARHYAAPYCYTYRGRLIARFKYLARLLDDTGEYRFPDTDLRRVVDNYEKWIKGVRNHAGVNMDGKERIRLPKATDDLHDNTAGSSVRGRFRKAMDTEEGRTLGKMLKDDLLHHAYFETGPLKLGAAQASLKINSKTGQPVPHKRIKEARKDVNDALMKAKKREAEAANHEFEVSKKLQTERHEWEKIRLLAESHIASAHALHQQDRQNIASLESQISLFQCEMSSLRRSLRRAHELNDLYAEMYLAIELEDSEDDGDQDTTNPHP